MLRGPARQGARPGRRHTARARAPLHHSAHGRDRSHFPALSPSLAYVSRVHARRGRGADVERAAEEVRGESEVPRGDWAAVRCQVSGQHRRAWRMVISWLLALGCLGCGGGLAKSVSELNCYATPTPCNVEVLCAEG